MSDNRTRSCRRLRRAAGVVLGWNLRGRKSVSIRLKDRRRPERDVGTYGDLLSRFPCSCRFLLVDSHCSHDDGVASSMEHPRRMEMRGRRARRWLRNSYLPVWRFELTSCSPPGPLPNVFESTRMGTRWWAGRGGF
jgi:hypothetical protein